MSRTQNEEGGDGTARDIIEIALDEFMSRKYNVVEDAVDPKIASKLLSILSLYDCFTKEVLFFAPASSLNQHHGHGKCGGHGGHGGHSYYKGGNNRNRNHGYGANIASNRGTSMRYNSTNDTPSIPPKFTKTPMKEVHGLLNKITANSYRDLVQKVIRCCAYKECSDDVIEAIIRKCYTSGSYAYLYHNLLREMCCRYDEQVRASITNFLCTFVEYLPHDLDKLRNQPNPIHNYEGYCDFIKRKTALLQKLQTALRLNNEFGQHYEGLDNLYAAVFHKIDMVVSDGDVSMFDYLDILSIIVSIMKKENAIPPLKLAELSQKYTDIKGAFSVLPKKIEFCWEEIIIS